MASPQFGAIILAAGLSTRMPSFKPLLQIEGKPLIEYAITLFRSAGVEQIVTVIGHRAEQLIPIISTTSSDSVFNSKYQDGMFSSVQKGIASRNPAWDAFFVLPVDIPLVRPSTIQTLAQAFRNKPSASVCYPCFQARRGHPPLLNSRLADGILAGQGQDSLRAVLRNHETQALDVPVDDPFIHMDADTRQDLEALCERHEKAKAADDS